MFYNRTPTVSTKETHEKITEEGSIIRHLHVAEEVRSSHLGRHDGTSRRKVETEVNYI